MLVPRGYLNPPSLLPSQKPCRRKMPPSACGERTPNDPSHVSPWRTFLTVLCIPASNPPARELIMFILSILIYKSILILFDSYLEMSYKLWAYSKVKLEMKFSRLKLYYSCFSNYIIFE